jgi:hypothetical protein
MWESGGECRRDVVDSAENYSEVFVYKGYTADDSLKNGQCLLWLWIF